MKKITILFFIQLFSIFANAQEVNLDPLINKAEKSTVNYSQVFKNLSADETKTNKYFNNDGTLDETRIVKSLFIVYQSPRNEDINEFRNPLEFNGKNVARSDEKIGNFFEKLAKADSDEQEQKKLREESNRFDGRVHSWGMTLFQTNPFGRLRPFFEYKLIGKETIEGREAIVIEYTQTKPTLLIKSNPTQEEKKAEPKGTEYSTALSKEFRPTNPRIAGKIWLDAETGQIWRNEFSVSINPATLTKPVVTTEILYEYQSSKFGVLVPKFFRFVSYQVSGKNDASLKVTKFADRSFEYSNFAEINSEIKKYEVGK